MDFADTPNEKDSGNPSGPPAKTAEAAASPANSFFVVNLIIYSIIALLILIFCVKFPCSQRQNQGTKVGRHEEALPLVSSSSFQSENSSIIQQPAQDEAAQGGQDPKDVQGLPQAQDGAQEGDQDGAQEGAQEGAQGLVQTQEPRDGDVRKRPGAKHVPWNDSVVGGNGSSGAAARACDEAVEYVNLNELREEMRASERHRASAGNEKSVEQDGGAKNAKAVNSSGEDTKQNDDDSTKGAISSPSEPITSPSASPNVEKENMTLVYFGIHSLGKIEEVLRARGTLGATGNSMSDKS